LGFAAPEQGRVRLKVRNTGPDPIRLFGGQKIAVAEWTACKTMRAEGRVRRRTSRGKPSKGSPGNVQAYVVNLQEAGLSDLNADQRNLVQSTIKKYDGVFLPPECSPPAVRVKPIHFKTQSDKPVYKRQHRLSPRHRQEVIKQTKKWLADGVIVPSRARWNCSTVCVAKKDGSVRLCLDLRALNATIEPVPFHMPNIKDTI